MKPTSRVRGATGQDEKAIGPFSDLVVGIINTVRIEQAVTLGDLIVLASCTHEIERVP
jgi:hypothetical protein